MSQPWSPLLLARETSPGVWVMHDMNRYDYAVIELRRTPDGPRYRITMYGEVAGWATSLHSACEGAREREMKRAAERRAQGVYRPVR